VSGKLKQPEMPGKPKEILVFARVITAQTTADGFDGFIRFAQEQLPATAAQQGFMGCYLLTDRDTGNLVTISLWDSREDVRAVEAHAARLTSEAAESVEVAPAPAQIYQVEIARLV
jgi:heme-degrading monooxygenase HmoA